MDEANELVDKVGRLMLAYYKEIDEVKREEIQKELKPCSDNLDALFIRFQTETKMYEANALFELMAKHPGFILLYDVINFVADWPGDDVPSDKVIFEYADARLKELEI